MAPARQGRCAPPPPPRTTQTAHQDPCAAGQGTGVGGLPVGVGGASAARGGAAGAQSAHKGAGAGQMAGPRSFGFAGPGPKAPGLQNAAAPPPTPPVSPPRYRVAAPCTATANMNIYRKTIKVYCISIKTMVSWFPEVDRIWKQRPWPG